MKRIQFDSYNVGDSIPNLEIPEITHMDLVRYSGASGDFNPIHTDPDFAKNVGLDETIAHGMYVMALVGRLITNWIHPKQLQSYGVKFKAMVKPSDKISCLGKIKRKKEEDGKKLITLAVQALVNEQICVSGDAVILCDE